MENSRRSHGEMLMACAAVIVVVNVVAGCGKSPSATQSAVSPTVTVQSTVPYPGAQNSWDIVAGIPSTEAAAASFAAETNALMAQGKSDIDAARSVRSRVVPELDDWQYDVGSISAGGTRTGGELVRAVQVTPIRDGSAFDVMMCVYPTPGEYLVQSNGALKRLSRSGPPWFVLDSSVQLTTEAAADGNKAETPRWLEIAPTLLDLGLQSDVDRQAICDRHAPDPLVQQPPAPLPSK